MLTNDLSNNNISTSPPPPPPPPPLGWKNTCKHNDKDGKSPSVTAEKSSSGNKPRRDQSKSPVQQSSLNFAENPLFKKKQEEHNVNSETADEGSNIRKSEKNRSSTLKPVSPRVLSPQQDNGNQHSGVQFDKDKPGEMKCESKNQKSSLAEQKKATGLKYSIAILLLCTSSTLAGVYTYFIISAVLSSAAVPVSSAVIAFVSALVMLSLAAYLINSHLSAINSEKGVDPGRKQSQYSELQKEAESLGHSNTPIPSLEMSGTPSAPPPPSTPVKSNDLSTTQRVIRKSSPSDANQKDVQQKQFNTSVDARSNLLAEIRKGLTLKKVSDEQKKNYLPEDGKQESDVQSRNKGVHQIRKVENQKTDKEPNNSESMQQMNSLAIAIQKQRGKSGFQNEQLDSLDENDHQEDSLFCLEEEQFKPASQEQKKCVQQPDAALSILKDKCMETKFLQPESPINNLSSNSANVPDDEDWETQPHSIPYIYLREKMKDRHNHNCSASSPTKMNNVELASSDMQKSSTVSVKEQIKNFQGLNK